MKTKKRFLGILLSLALVAGLMPGMSRTAEAMPAPTEYTLTIPSSLTVESSGWNATDGISVTGTLASGEKLTVTATSANKWALKSGENSISYTMKGTSNGGAISAWEFTAFPGSAALGIDVEDYSGKPAGTYTDTVTFTAKVENAGKTITVTGYDENSEKYFVDLTYEDGDTWEAIARKNAGIIEVNGKVIDNSKGATLFIRDLEQSDLIDPVWFGDKIDPAREYLFIDTSGGE
mgnify:CR=1 FL=1